MKVLITAKFVLFYVKLKRFYEQIQLFAPILKILLLM